MSQSDQPPARHPNGRFGPGNPGRQIGSRNRVAHRVAMKILNDFEEHQDELLDLMRRRDTRTYVGMALKLIPTRIDLARAVEEADAIDWTDVEVVRVIGQVRGVLETTPEGRAAMLELETLIPVVPPPKAAASTVI
jgi:hypothetical protein